MDEFEFWQLYFKIQNVYMDKPLSPHEINTAAKICSKPLTFLLDTKKAPQNRSRYNEISTELKISRTLIYQIINSLIVKGVLKESTDGFLEFNNKVCNIRKGLKTGVKEFDYTFEFEIL